MKPDDEWYAPEVWQPPTREELDDRADAWAAVSLVLLAVAVAIFWVSQQ